MATYRVTEDEFVAAGLGMLSRRLRRKWWWFALIALALGVWVFNPVDGSWGLTTLGVPVFLAVFVALFIREIRAQLRKGFREQTSYQEEVTWDFSGKEMRISAASGTAVVPWARIRRWSETPRFFYFHESDLLTRFIARRALSPEEEGTIRERMQDVPKQ